MSSIFLSGEITETDYEGTGTIEVDDFDMLICELLRRYKSK